MRNSALEGQKVQAKILRYHHNRTVKKALFLRNGKPFPIIEIKIGKRFELTEAQQIIEQIEKRRF